jgi:hypothetical protein
MASIISHRDEKASLAFVTVPPRHGKSWRATSAGADDTTRSAGAAMLAQKAGASARGPDIV